VSGYWDVQCNRRKLGWRLELEASIVLFCRVFKPWEVCCDHVPPLAALLRLTGGGAY